MTDPTIDPQNLTLGQEGREGRQRNSPEFIPAAELTRKAGQTTLALFGWLQARGERHLCQMWGEEVLVPTAQARLYLAEHARQPRERLPTRQERQEARAQAQRYRDYAEAWYRALRAWDVRVPVAPPSISYAPFTPGWEPLSTLGEGGPDLPSALMTPIGEVSEVEVARFISTWAASPVPDQQAAGRLLERVRGAFTAPRSLLRHGGNWAFPAPRMAAYGAAVLTLAVAMGDARAEGPLDYAQAVLRRIEPSEGRCNKP